MVLSQEQIQKWWDEFTEAQPMRIKSLLKSIVPEFRLDHIAVKALGSAEETLAEIEGKVNSFFREKSMGKLKNIVRERGELTRESTPYTQMEKLQVLIKKYPELQTAIDKLDLYL